MRYTNFLRTVLKLDAAGCLGIAALVLPTASQLGATIGMDQGLLAAAAFSLIPIGLFMLWAGTRREAPAWPVYLIVLGNMGWAAASIAVALGLSGITAMGSSLVAGQGVVALLFAILEWQGLRQSAAAPAAV